MSCWCGNKKTAMDDKKEDKTSENREQFTKSKKIRDQTSKDEKGEKSRKEGTNCPHPKPDDNCDQPGHETALDKEQQRNESGETTQSFRSTNSTSANAKRRSGVDKAGGQSVTQGSEENPSKSAKTTCKSSDDRSAGLSGVKQSQLQSPTDELKSTKEQMEKHFTNPELKSTNFNYSVPYGSLTSGFLNMLDYRSEPTTTGNETPSMAYASGIPSTSGNTIADATIQMSKLNLNNEWPDPGERDTENLQTFPEKQSDTDTGQRGECPNYEAMTAQLTEKTANHTNDYNCEKVTNSAEGAKETFPRDYATVSNKGHRFVADDAINKKSDIDGRRTKPTVNTSQDQDRSSSDSATRFTKTHKHPRDKTENSNTPKSLSAESDRDMSKHENISGPETEKHNTAISTQFAQNKSEEGQILENKGDNVNKKDAKEENKPESQSDGQEMSQRSDHSTPMNAQSPNSANPEPPKSTPQAANGPPHTNDDNTKANGRVERSEENPQESAQMVKKTDPDCGKEAKKSEGQAKVDLSKVKSIDDVELETDIDKLSISQMKILLAKASVNYKDLMDRKEFVSKLQDVWKSNHKQLKEGSEEGRCKICLSCPVNTVFLECGHMVACQECASHIRECPICRFYITRVVRVFQ